MCEDVRRRLTEWAAGTLDDAERAVVDAHLARCGACAHEAAEWRSARSASRAYGVVASAPLPAWRAPDERAAVASFPDRARRPALAWLAAAAAVALAVGAASFVTPPPAPSTALPRAEHLDRVYAPPALPTLVQRAPTPVRRQLASSALSVPRHATAAASILLPPAASAPPIRAAMIDATVAVDLAPSSPSPSSRPDGAAPPDPAGGDAAPDAAPSRRPPVPPPGPTLASTTAPTAAPTAAPPVATPATFVAVVAGVVTGPDGLARAEVRVVARPVADGVDAVETTSGADGAYSLALPPGAWSVAAEGAAYVTSWNGAAASPMDAPPLDVVAGDAVTLDFRLTAAPPGRISGRVVDAAGDPVPGALVVAAAPDVDRGGYAAFVAATIADGQGRYRLAVEEGGWLVAAAADWRAPALAWWGGDGDIVASDRVPVARQQPTDGIDIRLKGQQGD